MAKSCLIVRVWTERKLDPNALIDTMQTLWCPNPNAIEGTLVDTNLFIFNFEDETDRRRVLDNQPYQFNRHVLIMRELDGEENPKEIPRLFFVPFWVKIYDLPVVKGRTNIQNARDLGNEIGTFIGVDNSERSETNGLTRVRVLVDVRNPLCDNVKVELPSGEFNEFKVEYEKLPLFCYCYVCGYLGHGEKDCRRRGKGETSMKFGEWNRDSRDQKETVFVTVSLPEDVVHYNILTRVPAMSLLRFKCVSKDWYSLTKNPTFSEAYLKHALETPDDSEGLVICIEHVKKGNVCLYDAPQATVSGTKVAVQTFDIHQFGIVGSCNGLICLASVSVPVTTEVALCNPLTRECRRLTNPPNVRGKICELPCYGFGYDSVSRNYKIVRISLSYEDDEINRRNWIRCCGKIHVYSTSTGLWREIKGYPQGKYVSGSGVCLNNKLHWNVESENCSIITFDLGSEEFGEIQLGKIQPCRLLYLVVSGGLLYALWANYAICVMKEYGVSESWTELYDLTFEDDNLKNTWPLGYRSKNGVSGGEALMMKLVKTYELTSYNCVDKSTRKVYVPDKKSTRYGRAWMCTASLTPIPSL